MKNKCGARSIKKGDYELGQVPKCVAERNILIFIWKLMKFRNFIEVELLLILAKIGQYWDYFG